MRKVVALTCVVMVLGVGSAFAAGAGSSMFSIGLSQGRADVTNAEDGGGKIFAFQTPEVGVTGEYWYMFSGDYAVAVQGTFGFSSEKDEPGANAAPGSLEQKFTTSSFKVRLGGDRVGRIGDRFVWFFGPGLEFWSGKAEYENNAGGGFVTTADKAESPTVTRFGINGRVGGVMMLSDAVGIQGQVGNTLGYASAEQEGAKATWYPSSFHASWGLTFVFGGE